MRRLQLALQPAAQAATDSKEEPEKEGSGDSGWQTDSFPTGATDPQDGGRTEGHCRREGSPGSEPLHLNTTHLAGEPGDEAQGLHPGVSPTPLCPGQAGARGARQAVVLAGRPAAGLSLTQAEGQAAFGLPDSARTPLTSSPLSGARGRKAAWPGGPSDVPGPT